MSSVLLCCKDVCVWRGTRQVLSDVSLSVKSGELLALIGPNGAGKSTLLEAICGSLAPSSGQILLGGRPLQELSLLERARELSLVGRELSSAQVLPVGSIVSLGRLPFQADDVRRAEDEAVIERALSEMDCLAFRDRPLFSLSDGERQRVYFARALAQEASTLLLDEATAHLDLAHRERSFARARRFADEGGAVLAVAHDLDLALRHASRIVVLHHGRVIADDVPEAALSQELLRAVFDVRGEIAQFGDTKSLIIHGAAS